MRGSDKGKGLEDCWGKDVERGLLGKGGCKYM